MKMGFSWENNPTMPRVIWKDSIVVPLHEQPLEQ